MGNFSSSATKYEIDMLLKSVDAKSQGFVGLWAYINENGLYQRL